MRTLLAAVAVTVIGAAAFGCGDDSTCPGGGEEDRWSLDLDSMTLAVRVSDYLTYEFEMGTLDYYPPCASCD